MCQLRIFLLLLLCAGAASGLEIREKRWGFDGRVRVGYFNILSVFVANPDARAFDGQFALENRNGLEKAAGAPVVQPVYLAAGTQRWVQFQVFVGQAGSDWHLRWKGGSEKIDGAQAGPPARVLLLDPQDAFAKAGGLRAFPDDLFPTTVAATDALSAVALDHVPRWEPARRDAFLDWLRRGGSVHLVHGADGQFPAIPEALALLNTHPRVIRHEVTRADITEQYLTDHGHPAPELRNNARTLIYSLEQQLLQILAALTKPRIAWWLIYLLTAAYVIVVGPAHYRWSKRMPWLRSIALFVALVAGFGGAFAFTGRRGAGEKSQIRAIAIARSLGDGRHDVTQWISAFVTRGDTYRLTHAGPANLYATATEFDSVNGAITNGREGRFDVDIPLFSTRPFIHRGVLTGDRTEPTVQEWKVNAAGNLESLILVLTPELMLRTRNVWVRDGTLYYSLKRTSERWELDGPGSAESAFFSEETFTRFNASGHRGNVIVFGDTSDDTSGQVWMNNAGKILIARALGTIEGLPNVTTAPPLPANQLQLFLYADLPDAFRVQDSRFPDQQGRVLYVQDIFKP
ncbi:MAG: hypothetical protein ABIZ56_07330 [Chthoniobacteraceae bacterium]